MTLDYFYTYQYLGNDDFNDCTGYAPIFLFDPCETYDTNGTPGIQLIGAVTAVNDYFDYLIDLEMVIDVINCYYA